MSKKKGNVFGQTITYTKTHKGTSIGRKPITSTMNKSKRRPSAPGEPTAR